MNISSLLPNLRSNASDEISADENEKKWAPKNGPTGMRTPTNGQIRRAQQRFVKTAQRKQTSRWRRDWMKQALRLRVLETHLNAVLGVKEVNDYSFQQSLKWIMQTFGVNTDGSLREEHEAIGLAQSTLEGALRQRANA